MDVEITQNEELNIEAGNSIKRIASFLDLLLKQVQFHSFGNESKSIKQAQKDKQSTMLYGYLNLKEK